jgi:hypothetical protein
LQATLEGLFNSVLNPENFYPVIDALTKFIETINKLIDSIGGGQTVLTGMITLFGKLFSNNLANTIGDSIMNREMEKTKQQNALSVEDTLQSLGFLDTDTFQGQSSKSTVDFIMKGQKDLSNMSESDLKQYNEILEELISTSNAVTLETEKMEKAIKAAGIIGAAAKDTSLGSEPGGLLEMLSGFDKNENFKQYQEIFKQGKIAAEGFRGELENLFQFQKNLDKENLDTAEGYQIISRTVSESRESLLDLREAGVLQTSEFEQMSNVLDSIENELLDFNKDTDKTEEKIRELVRSVEQGIDSLGQLGSLYITNDRLTKTIQTKPTTIDQGKAQQRSAEDKAIAFNKGRDAKKEIKEIIEVTSTVGELAFAWQAFQNLGSL